MRMCVENSLSLASADIFQDSSAEALAMLEADAQVCSLAAGEAVPCDDPADGGYVYVVLNGTIGMYHPLHRDGALLLAEIQQGGSFGEFSTICGDGGSTSVKALTPTVVAQIPGNAFLAFLQTHPEASLRLLRKLVCLVRELDLRLARLANLDRDTTAIYRQLVRFTC
jgi:CRP-like cAMP-binding protein